MPTRTFQPLPIAETREGIGRSVGVEVEFSGLSVNAAADVLATALEASIERKGPHNVVVTSEALGDFELELDSAYLKPSDTDNETLQRIDTSVKQAAGDLAEAIVPVELVAPPVARADLPRIQNLVDLLEAAGATGTRASMFYAFGVHLNVEVVSLDVADVLPTLRAYAFAEPWLRDQLDLDMSRRLTPFIDPFPDAYRHWLAQHPEADWAAVIDAYTDHSPSRNRGLDMMPILLTVDEPRIEARLKNPKKNARPTFHFRLPNARVGDADWSLHEAWEAWVQIERIAAQSSALAALAEFWAAAPPGTETEHAKVIATLLEPHGLAQWPIAADSGSQPSGAANA